MSWHPKGLGTAGDLSMGLDYLWSLGLIVHTEFTRRGHQLLNEALGSDTVLPAGICVNLMLCLNSLVGLQHQAAILRGLVEKARDEVSVLKCLGFFGFV